MCDAVAECLHLSDPPVCMLQVFSEASWNASALDAFVQKNRLLHAVQWVPSMSHIIVNGQLPNLLGVADFAKEHSR